MNSIEPDEIATRITATLDRVPARRDHAELLEEMLRGFRQDGDAEMDETSAPMAEATGPTEGEAGGPDDA